MPLQKGTGISLGNNFSLRAKKFVDDRNSFDTISNMKAFAETNIPEGFITYVEETGKNYQYKSTNEVDETLGKWREVTSFSGDYNDLINKPTIPDISNLATKTDLDNFSTVYTKFSQLNIDETGDTVTLQTVFNALPVGTALRAGVNISSGNKFTDYPTNKEFGMLMIDKQTKDRFNIMYRPSMGSSVEPNSLYIATLQGNDGTGFIWNKVALDNEISNLATKTDLDNKAEINHTHDEYMTKAEGSTLVSDIDLDYESYLTLDNDFKMMNVSDTFQIQSQTNLSDKISYTTDSDTIASVSPEGLITKNASGKATITVTCGNLSKKVTVTDVVTKNEILTKLNIPEFHARGIKGKGIKVALIENFVPNSTETPISKWYDPTTDTTYTTEPTGFTEFDHTMGCAYILKSSVVGVAPDIELYNCLSDVNPAAFKKCVDWCIENKVDIVSISTILYCELDIRDYLRKLYNAGIIVVRAFGNRDASTPDDCYSRTASMGAECITLGGINKDKTTLSHNGAMSFTGERMDFVSYAQQVPGYLKPDGVNRYVFSGTSFSAPLTAGICALIKCQNPNLTVDEIFFILKDNAERLGTATADKKDDTFGYGIPKPVVLENIEYKTQTEIDHIIANTPIEKVTSYNDENGFYMFYIIPKIKDRYDIELMPTTDNVKFVSENNESIAGYNTYDNVLKLTTNEDGKFLLMYKNSGISKEITIENGGN